MSIRKWPGRPSPAMVVAIFALVGALGGSAIADDAVQLAAKTLNGKRIKSRSISGNKLKRNTVGGTEVRESRLGKVPSATSADRATNATNATNAASATNATNATNAAHATSADTAGSIGGLELRKISVSVPPSTARTTVLEMNGLKLEMSCSAGVAIDLIANVTQEGVFKITGVNDSGAGPWGVDDFQFTPAEVDKDVYNGADTFNGNAQLRWSTTTGKVVTADLSWEANAFANPPTDCTLYGTAIGG